MIQDITQRPENLYAVLRQAIQVERDGNTHYLEAARYTEYLPARGLFMRLAADEENHRNLLEATYAAYKKTGEPGALPVLGSLPDYAPMPPSPIFTPEFLKECLNLHSERSAISIGIMLEKNSIDFYQGLLNGAVYSELQALLRFLVQWEKSHLEILTAQMRYLDTFSGFDILFSPTNGKG